MAIGEAAKLFNDIQERELSLRSLLKTRSSEARDVSESRDCVRFGASRVRTLLHHFPALWCFL